MSEERRLAVLRAIVQVYVQTSEPVGSKALLERHALGVSAATVRNDMAALEDEGLIHAPHTSAGRVPTDAGYRLFVDRLSQIKPLSRAERTAIAEFLSGAVDLDDVVDRTVHLLASVTRQVAVMQYPSLGRSTVRHIELVPLGGPRLMLVLIVSSGRVEQRIIDGGYDVGGAPGEALISRLRGLLNAEAGGCLFPDAARRLGTLAERFPLEDRAVVTAVSATLSELLIEQREERVVIAGTANLTRVPADFPTTIGPVLDALEEHVVLLRLLTHLGAQRDTLAVRIGHEHEVENLRSTSVVTAGYGPHSDIVGGLGVLGPTRMDYPGTMAAVRTVARYVSEILST